MFEVECIAPVSDLFGESPVRSPSDDTLYWVDVTGPAIRGYRPVTGAREAWPMPNGIGPIGLARLGSFVAGMRSGFFLVDPGNDDRRLLVPLPQNLPVRPCPGRVGCRK